MANKTFDLAGFTKQLNDMKKENNRLAHLKGRYVKHAQEIADIGNSMKGLMDRLMDVAQKIDPVRSLSVRADRGKRKEQIQEIFDIMKEGQHVTFDFVQQHFPHEQRNGIYYILDGLKKLEDVEATKDGAKLRLFYHPRTTNKVVLSSIDESTNVDEVKFKTTPKNQKVKAE